MWKGGRLTEAAFKGIFFILMFEFDPEKSAANLEKQGIDFVEAQRLWDDVHGVTFDAVSRDERRFALIASLEDKTWTAFFTVRYKKIRLISVRRARSNERKVYEQSISD